MDALLRETAPRDVAEGSVLAYLVRMARGKGERFALFFMRVPTVWGVGARRARLPSSIGAPNAGHARCILCPGARRWRRRGDGASDDGGYLWEPGHQTLTCSVTCTCARTGEYVYVGQTIQEPRARDRQHRNSWQTVLTAPTSRTASTCLP